ncbi:MAG: molecular chaperone TorD family protein [Alphaproteobacteria bacterium]|nr:molecular chaperone TorD family protein [Alphaproteobacteria bacterium]
MSQNTPDTLSIPDEDQFRAQYYALLGRLLAAPPDASVLTALTGSTGDNSELGQTVAALADAARSTTPAAIDDEYHALFIGMTRGELVPYGSFYLTGFLHEKPLARLRQDMARLRIERAPEVREPEDHIAALCEMMAGLIRGDFGDDQNDGPDLATQAAFFEQHIAAWAGQFFMDLETADAAVFYRPVGALGRIFMTIETTAFRMAA